MKLILGYIILLVFIVGCGTKNQDGSDMSRKGFSKSYPASYTDWANGFLAGNGKMGVIVFGNPLEETIIYNDRDFFMAATHERSFNKVSREDLDKIREYCVQEKWKEANDLANEVHGWKNGGEGDKHPGFKMTIDIPGDGDVQDYMRTCDFRTGEITVTWRDNRGTWERKTFVSRKDDVVVQYLTAPDNGTISCEIKLDDDPGMNFPGDMKFTSTATTDGLNIRAVYPNPDKTNNAGYEGVTRVETDGGTKTVVGNVLKIEGAKSVTMLTRSKRYFSDCTENWDQELIQSDLKELPIDYNQLLKGQIETHQAIYDRVKIDFNASEAERKLPNEKLLQMQRESQKPVLALWERIFDSGRYLYLSSSSDYAAPDLLGIWTGDCNVGWSGYYHLDANLNLQIAAGNIGNMPEAMEGYFTLMERLSEGFRVNADKLLGCRGLLGGGNTAGLNGLISALNYYYPYQYVTGEMGWLLYPFSEHYLITGDVEFLRERLYPMLREMADFYEDFLVETDKNGKYIFAGSISPETRPAGVELSLVNNSSFDIAGAKFCLKTLIDASNILEINQGKDGVEKWQGMLDKMPPYLINEEGAFKEWAWPGLGETYGHRHSSLLLAAWPMYEITPEATPELYKAARFALSKKDEHRFEDAGHGLLQAALHACKLKYGESVGDKLMRLTSEDFYFNSLSSAHYVNNRVFCTDVCNSVPAVMIEMLVGSSADMLELLPALPSYLAKGEISGIKALNRVTVENMKWDLEKGTVECILKSDIDQTVTLIERQGINNLDTKAKVQESKIGNIAREITLKAGTSTPLKLSVGKAGLKNVALHRAVYQSSALNYDNTGHLVTDGIISSSKKEGNTWAKYGDSPSGEEVKCAFDNDPKTKFLSFHSEGWVQYRFSEDRAYAVNKYIITSGNDDPLRDPQDWTFEASNDGKNWTVLDTRSGIKFNERLENQKFKIDNTKKFKFYRFDVSKNNGSDKLQFSEVGLYTNDFNCIETIGFASVWKADASQPQWLKIDLGVSCKISNVRLFWDAGYAKDYKIEVSENGEDWKEVFSTTIGNGRFDDINFPEVSAHYVRMYATRCSTGEGYSLTEFEVYGEGGAAVTAKPQPAIQEDGKLFLTGGNWKLQRAPEVKETGEEISKSGYDSDSWQIATVPGTALVSYLNNGAIPDPNFGDQQLQISDAYFTVDYWYRNTFTIPSSYRGKRVWLNFNGINWKADVYVNGNNVGKIEGAFIKGMFDISKYVKAGEECNLAVFIHKNDTPGNVTVQTLQSAGGNGGVLGADNPTIHASIGWDWVPTIRGRNVGIQDDVFLSASGDVTIQYPFIKTTLPLPDTTSATLDIEVELKNNSDQKVAGVLKGSMDSGDITFSKEVEVEGNKVSVLKFTKDEFAQLVLKNPKLWWPNGYGQQNMHKMTFSFEVDGKESDVLVTPFGIRQVTTTTDDMLSIYVNGRRITMKGGNWGLSESMMRLDAQGYDDRVRMHKEENFTMIRNWVGMTGDEAFYDACDKYGVMIWDDFWLANPGDGPNPDDPDMFMENALYKVKHFRNHPAIALYCGRNEGNPPATLFDKLVELTATYDDTRPYIPHSADKLVSGWGPYSVQHPRWYMGRHNRKLHSEMGMPNVPTFESIKAMLPEENLWPINEMWGIHDYCNSVQGCNRFTDAVNNNYGEATGIEDFCRKAQMVNMENHKAMFEAIANVRSNGLLMWMSQSAWPSMVWQTYDYYLEQNAGFFGCKKACEPLHILWDNSTNDIKVTNNSNKSYKNLTAEAKIYNLDGTEKSSKSVTIDSNIDDVTECFKLEIPSDISATYFVKLKLMDGDKVLSDNFYWFGKKYQDHTALSEMNDVTLKGEASVETKGDSQFMTVEFSNPGKDVALTVRAKLLTSPSDERVLPAFYSDNYFSLLPGESKTITIEYRTECLLGGKPKLMVEGWNIVPAEVEIK